MPRTHGSGVQPVGVLPQLAPHLAQQLLRQRPVAGRQLADGLHAVLLQRLGGGAPGKQHIPQRQRPHNALPTAAGDHRGGIRLFQVAAQLGKHLVERHAHAERQSRLRPHRGADAIRQRPGVAAEQVQAAGHVQPALVNAEGLHQIGEPVVYFVDAPGIFPVQLVVGRQQHQSRTLLPRLPDRLRRFDAPALGRFVLGQDDAVAGLGVAAHRHRHLPQRRFVQQLHRREKAVQVTVQDHPIAHGHHLPPSGMPSQ